ncbi:acyl-CoA--sterol O-acyltransferase 1-like [Salvia hispanica]|uniref:acyl-CoA--sterol O-acyltransferase 1-like n=1 Tax=Salvia hispanica TaxID=49212 RepID=UPI0020099DA1|nr:acyl-CoA--sterol O-acyltransferase 1-like [Salvia hispanica]
MVVQAIIEIVKHYAQGEITNFIKVWTLVFASLSYCFFLSKTLPTGFPRLLAISPAIILNLILPLTLHTMHLGGSSAFFLAWLANFKLIMLAFGHGPLSDPSISLPKFAAFACLPIKSNSDFPSRGLKSIWNYLAKALLICLFLKLYDYTDLVHPKLTWLLYFLHIYCGLEIILAVAGGIAGALIGVELEPQFDEPYLSSSLHDFWGRRWNIMVSKILRPTVYKPVLDFSAPITGRRWAHFPAILASFFVSGLMHELIFYYLGRRRPSGELTAFFVLHGVCLGAEVAVKKAVKGRWGVPRVLAGPLTMGFVLATSFWLFFPEFLRCNAIEKAFGEYAAVEAFLRDVTYALASKSIHNTTNTIV